MRVLIASTNEGKINEIIDILSPLGFEFRTLSDFTDAPSLDEEGGESYCENAIAKAKSLAEATQLVTIADDSGLEVDFLHGAPGIKSARYAGPEQDPVRNIEKLVHSMVTVPCEKRTAKFISCIALAYPDGKVISVQGEVGGKICGGPRGTRGFGYDPVFMPDGYEQTFGELEPQIKNSISHRHNALLKLRDILETK